MNTTLGGMRTNKHTCVFQVGKSRWSAWYLFYENTYQAEGKLPKARLLTGSAALFVWFSQPLA